jgi:hypothetical protein
MFAATGDDPSLPLADFLAADNRVILTNGDRRGFASSRQPGTGSFGSEFDALEPRAGGPTVTDVLREIAHEAVHTVPACSAATICLLAHGIPRTAVVSDAVAVEADVAQYTSGEGPCLYAARTIQEVHVERLGDDSRFTHFAHLADHLGIYSALSSPVVVGSNVVGTVNLYSNSRFDYAACAQARVVVSRTAAATNSTNHRAEHHHV